MKVQAYYVRSRKLYFPMKFPQEVFGINDTLRYFIYGEGYKKTRAYDIVEIEIPKSKDNLDDIREVNEKYGKHIVMEYLVTNHSIYWQRHLFNIATMSDMTNAEGDMLVKAFDLHSVCQLFDIRFYNPIPNIIWLNDHLIEKYKYDIILHGSMDDFLSVKFGREVVDTLRRVWKLGGKKPGKFLVS